MDNMRPFYFDIPYPAVWKWSAIVTAAAMVIIVVVEEVRWRRRKR